MTRPAARTAALLLAAVAAIAPVRGWTETADSTRPAVDGFAARLDGDRALTSYRLVGVLDAEAEERIHSGIPVTFRHRIDVLAKRGVPLMPARVLARTWIETRVKYDSLTRRYDLFRRVEHRTRQKRKTPLTEEQSRITESLDEMRAWMTEMQDVPVFDPTRTLRGQKLRAHVEVSIGRHYVLLIFPATRTVSAEVPLVP